MLSRLLVALLPYLQSTIPPFNTRLPNQVPPPLPLTFSQVGLGRLPFPTCFTPSEPLNPFPKFDFVVCSFGLHLVGAFEQRRDGVRTYGAVKVEEKKKMDSELFSLLWELSGRADWLVVLNTGKKPAIRDGSGWIRWDLSNWAPAPHQGFGGKKAGQDEDEEDEDEDEEEELAGAEEVKDSAIEVLRDRSVLVPLESSSEVGVSWECGPRNVWRRADPTNLLLHLVLSSSAACDSEYTRALTEVLRDHLNFM